MRVGQALSLSAFVLCVAGARADVAMAWSGATGTIIVAHDDVIEGFDRTGEKRLWSANGLASPSAIVTSQNGESAAVLDAFDDRVAVVSVAGGRVAFHETPGTPVAAAFLGRDLWIVLRDHSSVLRISPDADKIEIGIALDPALVAASDQFVYVYSRAEGLLQEIDPKLAQVKRSTSVGTGGSDLEIRLPNNDRTDLIAHLCRPANGVVVRIDLRSMESREISNGGAPIDLAFVPWGAKLSIDPGTSIIADPEKQAYDRVSITGAGVFAFDSNSGTLYRIEGRTAKKIASGLTATSFVATDDALFTWDGKSKRLESRQVQVR